MIWSGVYESFEAAGWHPSAFVNEEWIGKSVSRLHEIAGGSPSGRGRPVLSGYPLAVLIMAEFQFQHEVDVLDIGGNLGQLALEVKSQLPQVLMNWHVLEREDFLEKCRMRVELPIEVQFHSSLHQIDKLFDLVHLGSVLQYVSEWQHFLWDLCNRFTPKWIAVSDAMVGDSIRSFVTRQRYYDDFLVSRFIRLSELVEQLELCGYQLVYKAPHITRANESYFPEMNLPKEFRIPYPLNLVFQRKS